MVIVVRTKLFQLKSTNMKYKCAQCGLAVIVLAGEEPIKACTCEAAIIAEMEAEATAKGGLTI